MTPHILLDMDGVIADFVTASLVRHNRLDKHDDCKQYNYWEPWGITAVEFWDKLQGREFWRDDIPLYSWSMSLIDAIDGMGLDYTILSSPHADVECVPGKLEWLAKHFDIDGPRTMFGRRKHLLANDSHVLIDDCEYNVRMFRKHGGRAILFPQPWNCAKGDWQSVAYQLAGIVREMQE
jgi:5'(3')-deoxyribonucleotidase